MKILVSGVPGVGKTTICQKLEEIYNIKHHDVSKIIIEDKLYENKNEILDTYDFKPKKIRKHLAKHALMLHDYIFETHTPEVVRKIDFDFVFILVIPLKELHRRLSERNYKEIKINENIECAIHNIVGYDCEEYFGSVKYIGSETTVYSVEETLEQIKRIIESE